MSITTSVESFVATITLNRPEKLNSFSGTMREELRKALLACDQDAGVRAVVITGAGRAFCAGGDVDYMAGLQKQRDFTAFRRLLDAGRDVILQIVTMRTPVIAAVNGVAAGAGCNLALACDYRIASEQAKLSQSFVRIGLHPDWGGTWLLPRLVGRSRAFEIMASGRMVTAEEALRLGMVDRVVPGDDLQPETAQLATLVAAAPPLAISGIKRALAAPEIEALRNQLELEAEHQLRCFSSNDAAEGMAAFFEKRTAQFSGS
ncbi:MAG TPA: enoyl-CoA hydratase-related protein [Thermoanaerobaculia bacterium]